MTFAQQHGIPLGCNVDKDQLLKVTHSVLTVSQNVQGAFTFTKFMTYFCCQIIENMLIRLFCLNNNVILLRPEQYGDKATNSMIFFIFVAAQKNVV